ncbi:amidase [Minwuia thermotolerans]|nr:amidase family protein [Minwuia thermotolerans]
MSRDYHAMTALELGRGVAGGDIDPLMLTEHFLDRIAEYDPGHSIFVSLTQERALAEAMAARRRAAAGLLRSPLDGVPIGWKDLFDTAGHPTEGASALFRGRVPDRDAEPLARAVTAGLVCLGKTNLPDLAYSGLGVNPWSGTPANAHSPKGDPRVPGGSSAGAGVSVAAGLAPAGIGSDTGGSVRIPAAFNGIVGLKSTWGAVSLEGSIPLAPSLDTVGPLTKDVADANAIHAILSGRPAADLAGASAQGLRLLWARGHDDNEIQPGVAAAVEAAVERLRAAGAEVTERRLDSFEAHDEVVLQHGNPISLEGWAIWGDTIDANPDKLYRPIRERIAAGRSARASDAIILRHRFGELQRAWMRETAGFDAVLQATTPAIAPSIAAVMESEEEHARQALLSSFNTRRINFLGLCAISLPCGFSEGLPVGLMATAGPNREGRLLRAARGIERAIAFA